MTISPYDVISKKIQQGNSFVKSKSFAASFGVHVSILAAASYFMASHPIPLPKSEDRIIISLSEFTSNEGDMHRLETVRSVHEHAENIKPASPVQSIEKPMETTSETTPMKQPPVSSEASAPLAHATASASTPPPAIKNDSPHLTAIASEKELPRISDNPIGGAALGHIRAMIEKAITYPAIARKLRLEGVVLVTFVLKPDGTVNTAQVKNTSGSNVLDAKAIQTILSLSGDYPPLGKTFELSIPIAFSLHKS